MFRIGSTIAVKNSQLGGNADTFMPKFCADALGFGVVKLAKLQLEIHLVKTIPYPA